MSRFSQYLQHLHETQALSEQQSYDALIRIFGGQAQDAEIVSFLRQLSEYGETVDELVGFTRAMREYCVPVPIQKPAMDVCGTGGSGKDRFNVSTAISFILASMGVPVAKHGNRGSHQPNGSFDFLESLGIPFELPTAFHVDMMDRFNLCFLFARQFHPAMKIVAPARKMIAARTVFNLVGPLSNPARVRFQMIGAVSDEIGIKLAKALQRLGLEKAIVVVGGDGSDDVSVVAPSQLYVVSPTQIKTAALDPSALGIRLTVADLECGDAVDNAALFSLLLSKKDVQNPISVWMCLSTAVALMASGHTTSPEEGLVRAKAELASGRPWELLQAYKTAARQWQESAAG